MTLVEATDTVQEITASTPFGRRLRGATRVQALRGTFEVHSRAQEPADPPPKLEETPLFPPPASATAGGSMWQEIFLYLETLKYLPKVRYLSQCWDNHNTVNTSPPSPFIMISLYLLSGPLFYVVYRLEVDKYQALAVCYTETEVSHLSFIVYNIITYST